jgi:hypothetical protein
MTRADLAATVLGIVEDRTTVRAALNTAGPA